ncbi:MAG: mechanosensitive ion channel [Polyangiaceae bacterium]
MGAGVARAQETGAVKDSAQRWVEIATPYVLKAVGAIVLFVIARIVSGWTGRIIRRALEARKFDVTMTRFFASLGSTLVLLAAILSILGMFGVETTSFAAVIGAAGLAVGLAFQGSLGNFASGVLLLTFRPFKVGDLITAAGETGAVDEIGLFVTSLITLDNRKIIIPNSGVTGANIINYSSLGKRRVDIPVGTAYGADLDKVRKALETVPGKIEKGLKDPAPQIFLKELGDSSINWEVRVWTHPDNYWDVYEAIVYETKKALDAAEIEIPFPQVTLTMGK